MQAICDTSSLIKLRKGDVLDCLGLLFDRVLIPPAVKAECKDPDTASAIIKDYIEVHPVKEVLPIGGIGRGELEAISLALELETPVIVIDDEKAARRALEVGCNPVRTTEVLLLAKHAGHISSVKTVLDAMRAKGEGIEDDVYDTTLSRAGEM